VTEYRVINKRTEERVEPGNVVSNFEGTKVIFLEVTRGPESGMSPIVRVSEEGCEIEYHAQVFRLSVERIDE